ncbi:MAG: lysoplasmalogenase [Deltaproteobacteria bacterium]|nr:lysoplasmalogenase [Deltaproteobacteria bacterium]
MNGLLVLICAPLLLVLVLASEKTGNQWRHVLAKALLSSLFILAAVLQTGLRPSYGTFILAGLFSCFCGDVLLALPGRKVFLAGLLSFLIGHVWYIFAFATIAQLWTSVAAPVSIIVVSGGYAVYRWLKPSVGSMNMPVILYIVVISAMVIAAFSVLAASEAGMQGRVMAFAGAVCFYISDIFVARNRFIKKEFINRLAGLPLYYTGQFLLAFSIGVT